MDADTAARGVMASLPSAAHLFTVLREIAEVKDADDETRGITFTALTMWTESLDLPAAVPTDDDTWRVVETWIEQRRVPGSTAAALLRAACTTVMRAYARGRLREAVRVSQHPGVRAMTEDQISAYVEASIREVLHQDAMRERYELIENAAYTSMARTTDDEYVNTWLDAEKSMLESPRFQILRDELVSAVDNAFDIARRARRARRARHAVRPPATPAANAPAKRRKIV